jgi:hypothetical protein
MFLIALAAVFFSFVLVNVGGTVPGTGLAPKAQKARTAVSGRPYVMVTGTKPLEGTGRSFKAGDRVSVRTAGKRKATTAGSRGRFVVRFAGQSSCNGGTIVAVGATGSRASVNFSQLLCLDE